MPHPFAVRRRRCYREAVCRPATGSVTALSTARFGVAAPSLWLGASRLRLYDVRNHKGVRLEFEVVRFAI